MQLSIPLHWFSCNLMCGQSSCSIKRDHGIFRTSTRHKSLLLSAALRWRDELSHSNCSLSNFSNDSIAIWRRSWMHFASHSNFRFIAILIWPWTVRKDKMHFSKRSDIVSTDSIGQSRLTSAKTDGGNIAVSLTGSLATEDSGTLFNVPNIYKYGLSDHYYDVKNSKQIIKKQQRKFYVRLFSTTL